MKKLLSAFVALVMVCALCVCACAEELYSMTATQGQYQESVAFPATLVMQDGFSRISTNWVGGNEYDAIINAINTPDTCIEVVYTGTISQFIIQTQNGEGIDTAVDVTGAESDGKNIAVISCADIIAAMPIACANDNVGWGNIAFICEDGTVLESFKVITAVSAPAEDVASAPEAPVEDTISDLDASSEKNDTSAAPAETGIVLCLLPMAAAAVAAVISKRR